VPVLDSGEKWLFASPLPSAGFFVSAVFPVFFFFF